MFHTHLGRMYFLFHAFMSLDLCNKLTYLREERVGRNRKNIYAEPMYTDNSVLKAWGGDGAAWREA